MDTKILVLSALVLLLMSSVVSADLFEKYEGNPNSVDMVNKYSMRAQTFTVGQNDSHTITTISLFLYRIGNIGNVVVSIKAVDSNLKPKGNDLTSGIIKNNNITVNKRGSWVNVSLQPYVLQKNTRYAIIIRAPSAIRNNYLCMKYNYPGSYSDGQRFISYNGAYWYDAKGDYLFREYGEKIQMPTLNLLDTVNHSMAGYGGVYSDGIYVYVGESGGIGIYVFNGTAFKRVGSVENAGCNGLWKQGNYLFAACDIPDGIVAYRIDGQTLTFLAKQYDGASANDYMQIWGSTTDVYGEPFVGLTAAPVLFVAAGDEGIFAYTFDGTSFGLRDIVNPGRCQDIWGIDTMVCTAVSWPFALKVYDFDGGSFFLTQTITDGTAYQGVWGDENYIYAANDQGLFVYIKNGANKNLMYVWGQTDGYFYKICGDGSYIYAAGNNICVYQFDKIKLKLITSRSEGGTMDICTDNKYIFTTNEIYRSPPGPPQGCTRAYQLDTLTKITLAAILCFKK